MISIKFIEYGNKRVWFQWFQDEWLSGLVPSFGSAYGGDNLWISHFCAYLDPFGVSVSGMVHYVCRLYGAGTERGACHVFFGKYKGTFKETGFFWVNPFLNKKKLSLRARNLDVEPIKVNDKIGNPILIGLVLVWKLKDTYKAMFEIDSQTMAASAPTAGNANQVSLGNAVANRMNAFENFVMIQSDAALRQVAGQYAYDDNEADTEELTLRSGGEEINEQLEQKLNERLAMAGMEVVEARINYLAYAPEIAAVMLRRQQASAIITAREKIVEGAVSMVKMALHKLSEEEIVELDEDKKAAMVSNLLVVLCADEAAQPVVNTGTLNH